MEREKDRFQGSFRTDYNTLREEQQRDIQATQEERLSAGELWDTVKQSEWVAPRLSGQAEFAGGVFSSPEQPAIPAERLARELGTQYSQNEYDFIAQAGSEEDYQARLDKVATDRELQRKIQGEGIRGIGYTVMAGMSDPALIPLYIGTGFLGAAGRGSLLARTAASGAFGAAEGAAVEALLSSADTQRDWRDVVMAGAAGGIFSSSITLGTAGFRRLRHGGQPTPDVDRLSRDPELARSAREADASMTDLVYEARVGRAVAELEDGLGIDFIQSVQPRQALIDELIPIARTRMSRGERSPLEAERTSLQSQVRQLQQEADNAPRPDAGGTNRQRAEAARARQARLEELDARVSPLNARIREVEEILEADAPARDAWADISRLQQGQIPKRYRDRYEALRDSQITPTNRSESEQTRRELAARRAEAERADAEAEAVRRPTGEGRGPDTQSAGAARVEGVTDQQDAFPEASTISLEEHKFRVNQVGENLPKRDWIRRLAGGGSRRVASAYSDLERSESNMIRGLAHILLSDPQAQSRGHIPAAVRAANVHDRLMKAEGGREAVARDMWAAEQGISKVRMNLMEATASMDFDNAVVLQINGIDQGSPAIRQAAEARADLLEEALKIRKESGEGGFENVTNDRSYWSFLPNFNKMQSAVAKTDADTVIDTLTGSYMNGKFKLRERGARMVARAVYVRTMRQGLNAEQTAKYALSTADTAALRLDMEEAGVSTKQIDDFLEEMEKTAEEAGTSNRAKLSLGADMTYSNGSLRMVDLLDTSVRVTNRYALETAAGSALARSGFKTRGELESVIEDVEKAARNIILREGGKDKETRSNTISRDAQKLKDSVKLLYGEGLDTDPGAFTKTVRGAGKVTNLVTLQWNGIASLSEASNQLVNMGVGTTIRNTRFRDFASFGKIRDSEDLQGFSDLIGAYGQLGASIKDNSYTLQTMSEVDQGRVERIFNNGAGWLSNKSQLWSGFRSIQHGLENVLMRSMQDRWIRIADGRLKPKARDYDEMERSGLTRSQVDEVIQHIRNNPETKTIGGRKVRIFSGKGLDPKLRDDLGAAMTSMMSRNMQRSFVGDTPIWMSKELGKAVTQHRGFSITSIEKQLAAGLRGDKIAMAMKTMFGIAIAYGAYSSRAWIRSQQDENPEERFERYMTGTNLTTGVVNMTPHLGAVGLGMELGYATGLLQADDTEGLSRYGNRPLTAEGAVPSLSVAFDAINAGRDIVSGAVAQDSERAMKGYNDAVSMLPIINSAAVGAAIAIANNTVD